MRTQSLALSPGLCVFVGIVLASTSRAEPPGINGISPFGIQRGVATPVNVNGANLKSNPRLIAPFGFRIGEPALPGSDAANARFLLTVDGETPVGVYPVRMQTDEGLSNLFLFAVGQVGQVAEAEDNSTFETAQVIKAPVVVEGQASANDVDYFRFAGKKGQRIVVDAQCARIGSGVDPSIRLTTAGHAFVASAEDSPGLVTDARLFAVLPEETDYVIELSDSRYQGGGRPIYRLVVGELPAAEELYPIGGPSGETVGLELRGGTLDGMKVAGARLARTGGLPIFQARVGGFAGGLDVESLPAMVVGDWPEIREPADPKAGPVRAAAPVVLNGRIDPAGDEDRFILAVTPGQKLRMVVEAAEHGSALDGVLQVLDAKGNQLAQADDTSTAIVPKPADPKKATIVSPDPSLDFTVPAGQTEVILALRDLSSRGGIGYPYRVVVTPAAPPFSVSLNEGQAGVPKGGTAAIGVSLVRKGYNGPITLRVENPPAGLTVRDGSIADGQTLGILSVSASADAAFGVTTLDVVAEAGSPEAPGLVHATRTFVFAQQPPLTTNAMTQVGFAVVPALALPVAIETPADPLEIAHGSGGPIPIKVVRAKDAEGALAVTALLLPPGLVVAPLTIGARDEAGNVSLNTTTDLPLGRLSVGLMAKGKIGGVERTIHAPAVTINVIKPAQVELATAAIEVKAGATVDLKGKVVRKGAFKEPVTVKLNGLPAGLKADPVTLAADASEFTLKIAADAKAAPATASASVALAFQINKKDYPAPTAALAVKVLAAN